MVISYSATGSSGALIRKYFLESSAVFSGSRGLQVDQCEEISSPPLARAQRLLSLARDAQRRRARGSVARTGITPVPHATSGQEAQSPMAGRLQQPRLRDDAPALARGAGKRSHLFSLPLPSVTQRAAAPLPSLACFAHRRSKPSCAGANPPVWAPGAKHHLSPFAPSVSNPGKGPRAPKLIRLFYFFFRLCQLV